MGAIQAGVNQSISIAAMLYTQSGHYEQKKAIKANEARIKATRARIDEIRQNYGFNKENIPKHMRELGADAFAKVKEKGEELIKPLEEELRQMGDPRIAGQDLGDLMSEAMKNETEHPNENQETEPPAEEPDSPAAQATKNAEKGVSEARAQKKQNPRYQRMHDKRKLARQIEKENRIKGGN